MVPDEQVTIIRPHTKWSWDYLREIWRYRELLFTLATRDIQVRYKQTVIGVLWAIIQPLVTMIIFTIMFSRLASTPAGLPYPVFSYIGLVLWTYFSGAVNAASASLLNDTNLITKVYFPRLIVPISATIVGLIDMAIALVLLVGLMVWYHVSVGPYVVFGLGIMLLTWMLAIGVGSALAAINVKYRDVKFAVPFALQLGIFLAPVIYPLANAPSLHLLLSLNPMTGYIEAWRSLIIGQPIEVYSLTVAVILTVIVSVLGIRYFRSVENYFADLL